MLGLHLRFTAVIPAALSAVTFALLIVLAVSGTKPGVAGDYYMLTLNTSKIGSNLVTFTPTTSSTGGGAGGITSDPTGILSGLGGLVNNATQQIDSGLQNLESSIVTNVTKAVGVKDEYQIFFRNLCEGTLEDSSDPGSIRIVKCEPLSEAGKGFKNITSSIPSSAVIGTTNVSVPILGAVGDSFGSIQKFVERGSNAVFAFLLIGLISSGLTAIFSVIGTVFGTARIVVLAAMVMALLAPAAIFIAAIIVTVVASILSLLVNGLGSALSLNAKQGNRALAIVWVSFALAVLSAAYWFTIWYVEFRKTAFQRVPRRDEDLGSYRRAVPELKEHLRVHSGEPILPIEKPVRERSSRVWSISSPRWGGRV